MIRSRRLLGARGFTLIEVMIVVGIIGILAVIGLFSYRKFLDTTHITEATHMVAAIREGQERYKAEVGTYADISTSITSTYPSSTPGNFKENWGGTCTVCNSGVSFATISVQTSDPVQFGYATVAGDETHSASTRVGVLTMNGKSVDLSPLTGTKWYVVYARDDADGDGVYTQVLGSSGSSNILIDETSP